MNMNEKKENLIKLWLYSFAVVNRSVGKLMAVILFSLVLVFLVTVVLALSMGTAGVLAQAHMMALSKTVGIGALVVYFLVMLGSNLYGLFFTTVCWRILGAQAEENPLPLMEAFSSSVKPAIYQFAAALLLAIPFLIVGVLAALLRNTALTLIVMIALFLTVGIRLCYSFISIAIADKGPLEGFTCSWNLTAGKEGYVDALLMCLMTVGTVVLIELFYAAIGYTAFMMIPTHFANGFSLAHLSAGWILAALVLLLLGVFVYFVALTFPVVVFLNRYALGNGISFEKDTTFVPLPGLTLPEIAENPAHAQEEQSTMRMPKPTLQAMKPQPIKKQEKPEVQVLQASINTTDAEAENLSEHLDKVYTPKPEDIVQYGDEDRMPTILFDEDMAKQLQANQDQLTQRQKTDQKPEDKDEGNETIKMSKF